MINSSSVILILIGTFIGAIGTLLIKKGNDKLSFSKFVRSKYFLIGIPLYGVSTVCYVLALRMEQLSIIYPLASMTYLWTTLFSVKYLGEKMNKWKYFGLSGIILGVVLIGAGS
tara:strand:- start:1157 stop:1498 length:342 start_codon:yes stop_codon:yes gene_type:complete